MTLIEWAIVIFLFIPLGALCLIFVIEVEYLRMKEEEGKNAQVDADRV